MSTDFKVKGNSSTAPFTLTLYRGEGMVLAAMNWKTGTPPRDFVGFAIEYKNPNRATFSAVRSTKNFPGGPPNEKSTKAPFQRFRAPASAAHQVMTAVQGDPGIARSLPPQPGGGGEALIEAIPTTDPSSPQLGATVERLRSELPSGALIGGPAAENHDLEAALAAKTPVVIGVVLALGFLLLLVAFQAPVAAAIGVVPNLLATGAAFGIAN